MAEYITPLIALITVAISGYTAITSYRANQQKVAIEAKTIDNTASDAVRDDLLQLVNRYEEREKRLSELVERLQNRITELLDQVDALRVENRSLRDEVHTLKDELAKFERKVFYRPPVLPS